jgi:hypothetical protein
MAMTKCKECGADVSNKAAACPRCGAKQVHTSGCAKIALVAIILIVFMAILGTCSRSPETATSQSVPPASIPVVAPQSPDDDLSLFISKYGQPDQIKSSENEHPRPPIVTKQLIYKKENVRAVYVADVLVGTPPPYDKWKLLGFQDNRTNAVIHPADAVKKLEGRKRE